MLVVSPSPGKLYTYFIHDKTTTGSFVDLGRITCPAAAAMYLEVDVIVRNAADTLWSVRKIVAGYSRTAAGAITAIGTNTTPVNQGSATPALILGNDGATYARITCHSGSAVTMYWAIAVRAHIVSNVP